MSGTGGEPTTLEADSNAIFNQTTQDCWFMAKHPDLWTQLLADETAATENMRNIQNGCEKVYEGLADLGLGPQDIESTNTGYACFGVNDPITGLCGTLLGHRRNM